jgi:putative acetyltransferase
VSNPDAPTVLIREKVVADLPEIADLWVESWNAAMPHIEFEERRAWFVDRMAEHDAAGARTLVALVNGDIAGFVVVDPATGYLDQLAVAPMQQRRGVAATLVSGARRVSPAMLELHVNQDNLPAVEFYKSQGFSIVSVDVNQRSGAPVFRMIWWRA